ncbi:MAG TPA: hypothetical protein VNO84_15805 [Burkholderiaceae bacterium]|nr:hypothetical protein [Burkholderiaceae bacterium]
MTEDTIPADLRDFALRQIDSIAHLEALLLLWREPEALWQTADAAARLYIPPTQAQNVLDRLASLGLVVRTEAGQFRYEPRDPAQHALLERLADYYSKHLIAMTHLIHGKRERRIQEFADAFRLRKGE